MGIVPAAGRMVADAGKGPHVVQGPDHLFTGCNDLADFIEREHSLIDPVQVDDIGLFEFRQIGDGKSAVGDRNIEQILSGQPVLQKDDAPFPVEIQFVAESAAG